MDECVSYAVERGMPATDGSWFFDRGLSSGWKNGGQPIKDWKATFRTWQINKFLPSLKGQQFGRIPEQNQISENVNVRSL